jgi:hypothetical protein
MGQGRPTKTFGIRDASDLLNKLRFDIDRLKSARSSEALRYAAFDCSIVSLHLADWVVHSVSEARCLNLCGKRANDHRSVQAFIERNAGRLPQLATCELIANSSKHLILRRVDDPSVMASSTVRFDPPFQVERPETWKDVKAFPVALVTTGNGEIEASVFFDDVAARWQAFLEAERLLTARPPEPYNIFS